MSGKEVHTADVVAPGCVLLLSDQVAGLFRGHSLQQRTLQGRRVCADLEHLLAVQAGQALQQPAGW